MQSFTLIACQNGRSLDQSSRSSLAGRKRVAGGCRTRGRGVVCMRGRSARVHAPLVLAFLIGACAVGPDFQRPGAVSAGTYLESPLPLQTVASTQDAAGAAQDLRPGKDLVHDWWTLF